MLDQSLLQSHFIGRDGFRWWIGQIPPLDSWKDNVDGNGWGNRYKVRIIGYHPLDDKELSNNDLPWAQVMLPTTAGTGGANCAVGVQLQPGDVVIGFFADGDNAQIPIIMGTLGNTELYSKDQSYEYPFKPFTGYSSLIQKNSLLSSDQTNEPTATSQPTPASVPVSSNNPLTENSAIGYKVPLANTVKNTQIDKITSIVKNLIRKIRTFQGNVERIRSAIDLATDTIVTLCNDFIGGMYKFLVYGNDKFPGLIGLLKKGLDLLYQTVFAQVLAATANPAAAHLAGVAAQQAMVVPVKLFEESLYCIIGATIDKLKDLVSDILTSTLDNVDRFVNCAAEQFSGSLLNSVVGVLENLLNGPLDTISKLLQFFSDFNVGNLLREGIGLLSEFAVGLACNQNANSLKGLVNEWTIGYGPSGSNSSLASSMANTYQSVKNITDIINSGVDIKSAQKCFTNALEIANPPIINIFGGRGFGATAIPIFGNLVRNSNGNVTASVIGVQLTNSGSGYTFPPFVEIIDDAEQGYGAIARSIVNSKGEVESIYIVSEGENYSVGNIEEYSVLQVLVENGGNGYKDASVTDNLGNDYNIQIVDERIYQVTPLNNTINSFPILNVKSNTGTGAILRPVLGAAKQSDKIQTSIDCIV